MSASIRQGPRSLTFLAQEGLAARRALLRVREWLALFGTNSAPLGLVFRETLTEPP